VITGTPLWLTMYIKDGALRRDQLLQHHHRHFRGPLQPADERQAGVDRVSDLPRPGEAQRRFAPSRIRDVSFSDIRIRSEGRVLVGGMPTQPLENLSFRNITMRSDRL